MARIEDYGLIGDMHTAALVSRDGSIDWLCAPRFDSAASLAALLGGEEHGCWRLAPEGPVRSVRRKYREGTLVLETELQGEEGILRVSDCMPLGKDDVRVVRCLRALQGTVAVRTKLVPRFGYGSVRPRIQIDGTAATASTGGEAIHLRGSVPLRAEDTGVTASFRLRESESVGFTLDLYPSAGAPGPPTDPFAETEETASWWRGWSSRCRTQGPWRDAVIRSLVTLKALTYEPSGAIVAAATTSLPERLGGARNWDYRYCWLRDATFTLYALIGAGYEREAVRWRDWLLRAISDDPGQLQTVYGPAGERQLAEHELPWLPGYEGSRPVRVGNRASEQLQLDVFGEVMDSLHLMRRAGMHPRPEALGIQRALLEQVETAWSRPDNGIWELPGERRDYTHSKVMAWMALDRAVQDARWLAFPGSVGRWARVRDEIHEDVCRKGWSSAKGAFVQAYGSDDLDAALLLMPLVGFLPASDPRVQGTIAAIERELVDDGFVVRFRGSSGPAGHSGEGAFLPCSFWLADCHHLLGRREEARTIFERLLGVRNDLGLLSEEYDPAARRLVGNFPQAFSHVALVNTARNLAQAGGPAEHRPDREGG